MAERVHMECIGACIKENRVSYIEAGNVQVVDDSFIIIGAVIVPSKHSGLSPIEAVPWAEAPDKFMLHEISLEFRVCSHLFCNFTLLDVDHPKSMCAP